MGNKYKFGDAALEGEAIDGINGGISSAQEIGSGAQEAAENAQSAADAAQGTADGATTAAAAAQASADTAVAAKVTQITPLPTINKAALNAKGAVTSAQFDLGSALPGNANVVGWDVVTTNGFTGPGLVSASISIESDADAAGSLMATTVCTSTGTRRGALGTNPYASRSGQVMRATVTLVGCTFAALTNGQFSVPILYAVAP